SQAFFGALRVSTTRQIVQRRRARRQRNRTGARQAARWLVVIALSFLALNVLGAFTGVGTVLSAYGYYAQTLPEPGAIQAVEEDFETTKIYDRTGEHLLYEVLDPLGGDRTWADIEDISLHMRQATVALEDKTFYENPGYDVEGIGRALWNNLTGG